MYMASQQAEAHIMLQLVFCRGVMQRQELIAPPRRSHLCHAGLNRMPGQNVLLVQTSHAQHQGGVGEAGECGGDACRDSWMQAVLLDALACPQMCLQAPLLL